MWLKIVNFQKWLGQKRLVLWWLVLIPVVTLILVCNTRELIPSAGDIGNPMFSLQFKIFNSMLLIVLARVVLVALGVVILMICLLFPVLRVGKEGIQWNKELEDELTEVSSEIAGEEINEVITQEIRRWTLIYGWFKRHRIPDPGGGAGTESEVKPDFVIHDLLNTLWEAFPGHRLSLTLSHNNRRFRVLHALMPRLTGTENGGAWNPEATLRLEIGIASDFSLLLNIYANVPEGFSRVDEQFLLVLGEIFRAVIPADPKPEKWFESFELISLTTDGEDV